MAEAVTTNGSLPAPIPAEQNQPATATAPPAPAAPPGMMSLSDLGIATSSATSTRSDRDDNTFTTDFNDESIKTFDYDLYKGRKGQTDRIAIMRPSQIAGARVHFKQGAGYFVCQSKWAIQNNAEICVNKAVCCDMLDEPTKRFSGLIIQYNTRPDGVLVEPFGFTFKLWRFTADKFTLLRAVNRDFPLDKHDVTVLCTEENYQRLTIQAVPKERSLVGSDKFWKVYRETIDGWVNAHLPKLQKTVGRKLSDQEMREKLGLATTPANVTPQLPVADIADLIG